MRRSLPLLVVLALMGASACKGTGTVQVSSLTFVGNKGIDTASLKAVIATRSGSVMPFSPKRYFDRAEFQRDVERIEAYYADHGYPRAKVVGVDVQLNSAKDKVALKVIINE